YFSVLGTPLIEGRVFAEGDNVQSPRVVLVDQTMVDRFWPDQSPIGKHIKFGRRDSNAPWMTVAGVVGNIKTDGFDQPDQPHVYVSMLQNPGYAMAVYLKTTVNPTNLSRQVR